MVFLNIYLYLYKFTLKCSNMLYRKNLPLLSNDIFMASSNTFGKSVFLILFPTFFLHVHFSVPEMKISIQCFVYTTFFDTQVFWFFLRFIIQSFGLFVNC